MNETQLQKEITILKELEGKDDHHAEVIKYIESRLQGWSYYYRRRQDGALGYPAKNILAAWRDGYSIQNRQIGSKVMDVNEEAEEIEQIVNEMAKYNEGFAAALRCHYFSRERNLRKQAEEISMSHTLFRNYIMAAKAWVASRLSTIKLR